MWKLKLNKEKVRKSLIIILYFSSQLDFSSIQIRARLPDSWESRNL